MKKVLGLSLTLASLLLLGGIFAPPASAQFLGYVSPQTVQQTLATNTACTGSSQNFSTQNLGQTQHWISATVSAANTSFTMQLFGIDVGGNATAISDIATVVNAPQNSNGIVTGTGYFPITQVRVVCSGGTFTLNYSGSSSSPILPTGGYSIAAYDKALAIGADATANQSYFINVTPAMNASGLLVFDYTTNSMTGSTLTIQCGSTEWTSFVNTPVFSVANLSSIQFFTVPSMSCPYIQVLYTHGTIVAGTKFSLEYLFAPPGQSSNADPCQNSGTLKSSAVVTAPAASTTQIIAGVNGKGIYVCGYQLTQTTAVGTVQWEYGTGASCGTGTTTLTGAMPTALGIPVTYGGASETVLPVPTGNSLCLVTAGAAANAAGVVTYVQQ